MLIEYIDLQKINIKKTYILLCKHLLLIYFIKGELNTGVLTCFDILRSSAKVSHLSHAGYADVRDTSQFRWKFLASTRRTTWNTLFFDSRALLNRLETTLFNLACLPIVSRNTQYQEIKWRSSISPRNAGIYEAQGEISNSV